ncbi:MAG: tetratricopeptide repeat protein [Ignavibacteriaceae bacterium]|nr:tetratricopeptide repeat protein [Ignavibacteriaceae bacterium]NUM69601.1 tetratricopeptide repeat protein [Ignavibacteriaceae bacterium]
MSYKCPGCNTELESDFRYCPSCGIDLREALKPEEEPLASPAEDLIAENESAECAVCGELNNASQKYCKSCGAVINEEGTDNRGVYKEADKAPVKSESTESVPEKKDYDNTSGKNSKKGKKDTVIAVKEKSLSNAKIFGFLGVLAVLSVVMMSVAGTFDSPKLANNQDHVHTEGDGHNHGTLQIDPQNVQAIEQLKADLVTNPADHEKRLNLAHLLSDNGNFQEAIDNYKTYLAANPGIPEVIIDMGVCYFNMNNLDEAERIFLEAIKINPKQQIGLLNLGVVNLQKNNISKAKEWLQKAVDVNPASPSGTRAKELLENQ